MINTFTLNSFTSSYFTVLKFVYSFTTNYRLLTTNYRLLIHSSFLFNFSFCNQVFGNLDGIQGSAFSDLVADAPKGNAVGV